MFITVTALISRILSNPAANALQKLLSTKYSSISINVYSYFFLSLFCLGWIICASLGLPNLSNSDIAISGWSGLSYAYWSYVALAGILCTLGSVCLIKALQLDNTWRNSAYSRDFRSYFNHFRKLVYF